jgi:hypothetical protein
MMGFAKLGNGHRFDLQIVPIRKRIGDTAGVLARGSVLGTFWLGAHGRAFTPVS